MLKVISAILFTFLVVLSYRFWFGADSIVKVAKLKQAIALQDKENNELRQRNQMLIEKINKLKSHPTSIEEQARYELGMVKRGEKYYQVIEPIQ